MNKLSKSILAAVFAFSVFAASTQATLVLDLNTGGSPAPKGTPGTQTFGWSFSVSSAITIDGLGIWDAGADGIGSSQQVGLWTNAGSLLASSTVSNSSTAVASASANGNWLFENVTAVTLLPGIYVVGSTFSPTESLAQIFAPFTTIAQVALIEGRSSNLTGLNMPTDVFNTPIFGPTLRLSEAPPVPAPAASILGLAGFGLLALRRHRH